MIKAASGESQFHAIVRGIATALDMKSAKRYGHEVKVVIETDAVDGRGVSLRLSAGRSATQTPVVVAAGSFPQAGSDNSGNPRNQQ